MISHGSLSIFVTRPFSVVCLALNLLLILSMILRKRKERQKANI